MKKYVVGLLLVFIASLNSVPSLASPRMELSLEDWDLGVIYQWSDPTKEITIKNTGDQDLLIQGINTSCGCTAIVLEDKLVKPGGKTAMKIDFAAYNFSGRFRKEVVVVTNAGSKTVSLHGTIKAEKASVGEVEPDVIDLGVVAPYETKFFKLTIRNKGNIGLPVKGIDVPKGFFMDSAVPEEVSLRGLQTIRLGYRPVKSSGPIDEDITVQLSNSQKELRVKVLGYIAETGQGGDAVIITPASIKVSSGTPNPSVEVGIKNQGGGVVEIESVDSSFDGSEAELESRRLTPGGTAKVVLSMKPESLKQSINGYLYIRVAVPIEVEGAVKK